MNPEVIGLHLENHHLKKLTKGGTVQLSNAQLHNAIVSAPTAELHMARKHVSELLRAHRNGRGYRLAHHKIIGGKITLHSIGKAFKKAGHTVVHGAQQALKNPVVRKVAKELSHIGIEMANNYAQQQGVDTNAYADLAHHAVESKNVKQALQNQVGNDVMNYAHEKAYQHMQGGKIKLPKIHISNATKKGFSDFGHGFVKGFTGTMKNPIVQGVATNLITGALMGGAGKPKRFVKGSAEAKAHMAKIRGMKKGGSLYPAGSL
jgi:hypothetical protein